MTVIVCLKDQQLGRLTLSDSSTLLFHVLRENPTLLLFCLPSSSSLRLRASSDIASYFLLNVVEERRHLGRALRRLSLNTKPLMCLWLLKPILQLRLRRTSEAG